MVKKKPPGNTPGSDLGPEDAALWERVAGSAEPLKRGRNRWTPPAREDGAVAGEPKQAAGRQPRAAQTAPAAKPPPIPPSPPPLARFDARDARQLRSGRADIDARVDLHGLRQREAHAALKSFLARAQAAGHRTLLVITGKGGAKADAESEAYPGIAEPSGVLRRAVPRWLGEPELRRYVVSYAEAGPRHGGEGALYVRLRKGREE